MHNSSPFLNRKTKWFDDKKNIDPNLGVLETTYNLASEKCKEFLGSEGNLLNCNRNLTAAALCVVEYKASNLYGDVRDNVFICKNDIKLLKNSLGKEYNDFPFQKMDNWLKSISQATSHIYKI
jgi:hypothetical protein